MVMVLMVMVVFRHLGRLSQRNPFKSAVWLAKEMVKWERESQLARPSGAVFPDPTPVSESTIRNYLKDMGIQCCRCRGPLHQRTILYCVVIIQAC